jgi:hypothetical protein
MSLLFDVRVFPRGDDFHSAIHSRTYWSACVYYVCVFVFGMDLVGDDDEDGSLICIGLVCVCVCYSGFTPSAVRGVSIVCTNITLQYIPRVVLLVLMR